jgi:rubrerythrin
VVKKIGQKREGISKACLDDVAAIESGMELENSGIEFFSDKLKTASLPTEREFLNHMIAEERSHYIMLADLRFYYIDTGNWFMEKAKTGLDGA